jgi:hypothetical protein
MFWCLLIKGCKSAAVKGRSVQRANATPMSAAVFLVVLACGEWLLVLRGFIPEAVYYFWVSEQVAL